jgi:hypothetical protein
MNNWYLIVDALRLQPQANINALGARPTVPYTFM